MSMKPKDSKEQIEGTAIDPSSAQILTDIRTALSEFYNGEVFEIQSADDLLELVQNLD